MSSRGGWFLLMAVCLFSMVWLGAEPCYLDALFEWQGDSLQSLRWLKSTFEPGGYYANQLLGAPMGASHHGFPRMMALDLPFLAIWHSLGASPALFYNLFYLAGFFLCAASAYWVLLRWNCRWQVAALCAWLYAFLPGHIDRYSHPTMILYFCAPLAFFDGLMLMRGQSPGWSGLLRASLAGLCGPYIAFFYCLVLGWAGLLGGLRTHRPRSLAQGGGLALWVAAVLALSLAPDRLAAQGEAAALPYRAPADLITWSSSLGQLVLPQNSQRKHPLHGLAQEYFGRFPQPSPFEASYLGWPACLGLVWLLVEHLKATPRSARNGPPEAGELAMLALGVWLFQSVGGLNQLLSLFLGTAIRSYNRLSFWLAFLGLAALALQASRRQLSGRQLACLTVLALLGFYEQSLASRGWHPRRPHRQWTALRTFVAELEQHYPRGSQIWQLPRVGYPERPPLHQEGFYGLLRPYLVSDHFRWSTGSVEGSRVDRLQQSLALLPWPKQLEILRSSGFQAVLVERSAFADGGRALEGQLRQQDLPCRAESADGSLACYDLGPLAPKSAQNFESRVVEAAWRLQPFGFRTGSPGGVLFRGQGWGDLEPHGCWSLGKSSRLELLAPRPGRYRAELLLLPTFNRLGRQRLFLRAHGQPLGEWRFRFQAGVPSYRLNLELQLPCQLEFRVDEPQRPSWSGSPDTRPLGVQLQSLRLSLAGL